MRLILAFLLSLWAAVASAQVTPGTSPLSIPKGGTGGATAAAARASLGLNIWVDVKGDGTTDVTASIQAAIDAAPSQATLNFPVGTYIVSGSGSCALTIGATNKSLTLSGAGFASWIKPAPGFPSGRDLICFKPTAGTSGGGVNNMRVGPSFGSPLGRHAIHVDMSDAGNAASVTDFELSHLLIPPTATGRSIYLHSTATNLTGGVFYSRIEQNDIESILAQYIGDGVTFDKQIITGSNAGIDVSQITGSGGLIISRTVVANTGGCIIIRSGIAPVVGPGTICEQTTTITETNGAIIDITGDIASVTHPQIINSQVQATIGPTGITTAVRVATATNALISGSYLAVQGSTKHIITTAAASNTVIGQGNQYWVAGSQTAIAITDGGTATTYNYQSTAPTGTSGAMPFFNSSGNLASSALLNGNAIVFGGGAGTTPYTGNVSTDGQLLFGQTGSTPQFITPTGNVSSSAAGVLNLVTTQAGAHTWSNTQTFTVAPVFTDASGSRTALGLGTAATQNTGTSGANVPLLNGANTWASGQTFSAAMTYGGVTLANSVTGTGSLPLSISPTFTGNVVVNSSAAGSALAINGTNAAGTQLGLTSTSTSVGAFFFFNDGTNTTINGLLNATFGCKTGAWAVYAAACRLTIDQAGNVAVGAAALAANATDGFLYIDSGPGTPTGTPTTFTGRVPIYYDTTNHKICYYDPTTPSWRCSAAM